MNVKVLFIMDVEEMLIIFYFMRSVWIIVMVCFVKICLLFVKKVNLSDELIKKWLVDCFIRKWIKFVFYSILFC